MAIACFIKGLWYAWFRGVLIQGMVMAKRIFTIGLMVCLSFPAMATVYRWQDAEGTTHFTQYPPADRTFEVVNVRNQASSSAVSEKQRFQTLNKSLADRQAEREAKKKYTAEERERMAKFEENCKIAQENLKLLGGSSAPQIEENGVMRALTADEVQRQKADNHKHVKEFCGG